MRLLRVVILSEGDARPGARTVAHYGHAPAGATESAKAPRAYNLESLKARADAQPQSIVDVVKAEAEDG